VFPRKDVAQYTPGLAAPVAFACAGMVTAVWTWYYGVQENKKREADERDHLLGLPQEEKELLGERPRSFRFTP
jgi:hypothetical protein